MKNADELSLLSPILRRQILIMINAAGSGHPGGSLSTIDLLAAVMIGRGRFAPDQPVRDWLVLAKGHAAPALYAVLANLGYLDHDMLLTYRHLGTHLQGHPDHQKFPPVQVTTGHLGHGLSIGLGIALGESMSKSGRHVYVVLGNGDLHEGQTWEAVMAAAHYKAANLTALLDANGLSQHGPVEKIMNYEPVAAKLESFGWWVRELNGHDYGQLLDAIDAAHKQLKPTFLICRTIKGKGVSFMEGDPLWHSRNLPDKLLKEALAELEGGT